MVSKRLWIVIAILGIFLAIFSSQIIADFAEIPKSSKHDAGPEITDQYLKIELVNPQGETIATAQEGLPSDKAPDNCNYDVTLDLTIPGNEYCTPGLEGEYYLRAESVFPSSKWWPPPPFIRATQTVPVNWDSSPYYCSETCTTIAGIDYADGSGCCGDDGSHAASIPTSNPYTWVVGVWDEGMVIENLPLCDAYFVDRMYAGPFLRTFPFADDSQTEAQGLFNGNFDRTYLLLCSLMRGGSLVAYGSRDDQPCNPGYVDAGKVMVDGFWGKICSLKDPGDRFPITFLIPYQDTCPYRLSNPDCPTGYRFVGSFRTYGGNCDNNYEANNLFNIATGLQTAAIDSGFVGVCSKLVPPQPGSSTPTGEDCGFERSGRMCTQLSTDGVPWSWAWMDLSIQGQVLKYRCKDTDFDILNADAGLRVCGNNTNTDLATLTPNTMQYFFKERASEQSVSHEYLCLNQTVGGRRIQECKGNDLSLHRPPKYTERGMPAFANEIATGGKLSVDVAYFSQYPGFQNVLTLNKGTNATTAEELGDSLFFHCMADGNWTVDLDNTNKESCEGSLAGAPTGYKWSGSLCCGEENDAGEFYNELNPPTSMQETGGCWDGSYVRSGANPLKIWGIDDGSEDTTYKQILNYNGTFYGCNLAESDALAEFLDLRTMHPPAFTTGGTALIHDVDYCSQTFENAFSTTPSHAYCSYSGEWKPTGSTGTRVLKQMAWEDEAVELTADCCGLDECWDGSMCVQDETSSSSHVLHGEKYRCISGEWVEQVTKYNWDRKFRGFCPGTDMCLVKPTGKVEFNSDPSKYFTTVEGPACIDEGQYIKEHYCENGEWGSRTKLIALQLLGFAQTASANNYELFCDDFDQVLNYYDYFTKDNVRVRNFIGSACALGRGETGCVNQICVLKYGDDQLGFGTSLNIPLDDSQNSFLKALNKDITFCNNVPGSATTYQECGITGSGIWFNPALQSVIYLPGATLHAADYTSLSTTFLENPFTLIKNTAFEQHITDPPTYLNILPSFSKLYIAKKGGKEAFGFMEQQLAVPRPRLEEQHLFTIESFIGIRYKNFDFDACTFIQTKNKKVVCDTGATEDFRVAYVTSEGGASLITHWRDITAKLRP